MISVILNCQPMDEKMFRKKKIARVISCWIFRLNSVTTSSCHQIRKWAILHLHIISIKRRTWILCELSKDYSNFDITFKSKKRNYLPYSKYWWQSLLFHFFFFFSFWRRDIYFNEKLTMAQSIKWELQKRRR